MNAHINEAIFEAKNVKNCPFLLCCQKIELRFLKIQLCELKTLNKANRKWAGWVAELCMVA